MTHMQFLLERSDAGEDCCGHALMASCPPDVKVEEAVRFGHDMRMVPDAGKEVGQKTWDMTPANLAVLLDLSMKINLDGELTPVMAWGRLLAHPRLVELGRGDIDKVKDELLCKIRCYG